MSSHERYNDITILCGNYSNRVMDKRSINWGIVINKSETRTRKSNETFLLHRNSGF